jgi:Flp pilus assembly protein TadD
MGWTRAVGLGCGLLAVLTKEPALTLPAAIALVDFATAPQARGRWRRVGPYVPLALVPLLAAWLGGQRFGADEAALTAQTARVTRSTYLFTQVEVLARYLRLLVLPIGQNIDHDVPWRHSALEPAVMLAGFVHAALWTWAVVHWRRGGRLLPLAIGWWYLTLLPESSVFPIADAMVEHRLYAAMPGFALAVALPLEWLCRRRRAAAVAALVAVVGVLGAATVERNRVWHDPYALWRDAMAKSPAKGRPHAALGWLHHKAGREEMAVEKLEQAVALDARDPQAWNILGLACQALGRHERAVQAFQAAVDLRPQEAILWLNLAVALENLGRVDEALHALDACLQRDPTHAGARARREALRAAAGQAP